MCRYWLNFTTSDIANTTSSGFHFEILLSSSVTMVFSNGGFICILALAADPAQPPFAEVQCMLQLSYQHTAEMSNYLNFLALAMCLLMKLEALLISL